MRRLIWSSMVSVKPRTLPFLPSTSSPLANARILSMLLDSSAESILDILRAGWLRWLQSALGCASKRRGRRGAAAGAAVCGGGGGAGGGGRR